MRRSAASPILMRGKPYPDARQTKHQSSDLQIILLMERHVAAHRFLLIFLIVLQTSQVNFLFQSMCQIILDIKK